MAAADPEARCCGDGGGRGGGGSTVVVGLISDTHGVLREAAADHLQRATALVLHAGDVGDVRLRSRATAAQVLGELRRLTGNEVVAVAGNTNSLHLTPHLPQFLVVTVACRKILLLHVCGFPPKHDASAGRLIKDFSPDIVVFGHSHVPGAHVHEQVLYVNPGSAGPRRFKLPLTVALLSLLPCGRARVEFHSCLKPGEAQSCAHTVPEALEAEWRANDGFIVCRIAQTSTGGASTCAWHKVTPSGLCISCEDGRNKTARKGSELLDTATDYLVQPISCEILKDLLVILVCTSVHATKKFASG
eukprot:SM000195S05281  [mRNA]  locus=s195:180162:182374:+ [translate_table: standard]